MDGAACYFAMDFVAAADMLRHRTALAMLQGWMGGVGESKYLLLAGWEVMVSFAWLERISLPTGRAN